MAIDEFHYVITQLGFSRLERYDLFNWERLVSYIRWSWTAVVFQVEFVEVRLRYVRGDLKFDLVIELLGVVYFDLQTIFNSLALFIFFNKIKEMIDKINLHSDSVSIYDEPSFSFSILFSVCGFILPDNRNLCI